MAERPRKSIVISALAFVLSERARTEWVGDFYEVLAEWQYQRRSPVAISVGTLGVAMQLLFAQLRCTSVRVSSRHARQVVVSSLGLLLSLTLSGVLTSGPGVIVALTASNQIEEWPDIAEVMRKLGKTLRGGIELRPIDPDQLVTTLDYMVANNNVVWDLISVDMATLGILAQKGLVQELSSHLRDTSWPSDPFFRDLQQKLRIDGRDYAVPIRVNVKLTYANQDILSKAGYHQPPTTWDELEKLAPRLASDGLGRMAIQAHAGKAAAVTVFEWVTSMGGDPMTLADAGTREAFKRLWTLAPYLDPASSTIRFDTANHVLVTDRVALVDNWTYSIQEVTVEYGKKNIKVTPGLQGSVSVLGGDVLVVPAGISQEQKDRAIRAIKQLVAKETQRALAEALFWAPVREDVYEALSAQEGLKKKYFEMIREVLRTAVMRPITPQWALVEATLSDALQDVLRKGRAQTPPATEAAFNAEIDDLLRPYRARLQAIPHKIVPCSVVERVETAGTKNCQVPMPKETSFKDLVPVLAPDFGNIDPTLLAMLNGRSELDPVGFKTTRILLMPGR